MKAIAIVLFLAGLYMAFSYFRGSSPSHNETSQASKGDTEAIYIDEGMTPEEASQLSEPEDMSLEPIEIEKIPSSQHIENPKPNPRKRGILSGLDKESMEALKLELGPNIEKDLSEIFDNRKPAQYDEEEYPQANDMGDDEDDESGQDQRFGGQGFGDQRYDQEIEDSDPNAFEN